MAYDVGARIGIEGEKEFKQAVSDINKDLSVFGSELKKVTAQFDTNSNSMGALTAKSDVYNKQIDAQKQKIETLKAALAESADKFGENDAKTKNWQIALNKAETDLAKTENSLKQTTDKIDNFGDEAKDSGNQVETAGHKAKNSGDDAEKGESGWSKLGNGLSKVGGLAVKAVAGIGVAAAGAAAGIGAMTVKAAANADEILTLATQTGLSTEEIQKFQYAAELIDVPLETVTGSMAKLTKNMESARTGSKNQATAFAELGVSVTDVNGELRSNQDVFAESIDALGEMENGTQRDALAMQIFGKSAQDLNPLILGGADALKEYGEEAEAAGLILSEEALGSLGEFDNQLQRFKSTISGSGNLFATVFAGPMAEGLETITEYLRSLTTAFNEGGISAVADQIGKIMVDVVAKINEALPKIVELGLNIITTLVDGIIQNIPMLMESAITIITILAAALLDMLPDIIAAGVEVIVSLAMGIAESLPTLIPMAVDAILTIVDTLLANIDAIIDAAIAILLAFTDGIIGALPKLIEKVPEIIITITETLAKNMPKIIEAGIEIIVALAGALVKAIPELLKAIPQVMLAMLKAIGSFTKDFATMGGELIEGLWNGISDKAEWLWNKVSGFFSELTNKIKDFFGIASPSKVFAQMGGFMAEGLGVGFGNEMKDVTKKMQRSVPTNFELNGAYNINPNANGYSAGGAAISTNNNVNVYVQQLSEAQQDYLFRKFNARLGVV